MRIDVITKIPQDLTDEIKSLGSLEDEQFKKIVEEQSERKIKRLKKIEKQVEKEYQIRWNRKNKMWVVFFRNFCQIVDCPVKISGEYIKDERSNLLFPYLLDRTLALIIKQVYERQEEKK